MSDNENGLADDLFGGSDDGAPQQQPPNAEASGSGSPREASASDAKEDKPAADDGDGDGDEGGDLFGDDDDDEGEGTRSRVLSSSAPTEASRSRSPNPLEYAEEDIELEEADENWANLPVPQWPHMQATDGKVWHMKLPAYVNVESKPYEPDLYRAGLEGPEIDGKENPVAARAKMIGVRNTIRWKWVTGADGEPERQSNARMLRWSDGSVSLQLGSDLFDVAPSHGATLARPQDPTPKNLAKENPTASTTFLAVIDPDNQVLVTERAIAGQLTLVPTSMTSKTHLELAKHVGQQHVKHSKMKILDDLKDQNQINELLLKAAGATERGFGGRTKKKTTRGYSDDEEDYSSDEPRSRRAGAGAGVGGRRGADRFGAEAGEYDEDDGFVVADDDEDEEEEEEDEDENDDDAAYGSKRKSGSGSKSKSGGKKRSKRRKSEESLDEMEEAERRIEERERERKRAKKEKSGGASGRSKKSREYLDTDEEDAEAEPDLDEGEEEMEMDVESEED
ncbi:hypothetical protein EHS25_004701 [Saitozyma podzolica]|uniref:RNA polymerase-associated protein LEO1 n=1 Tax=Saitozyma podzolica TaxID=1890683 RepID=A0A427YV63_9TREE|nr:hypothetical protein EHS25_004701 [Saitozyma podzolica]